MCQPEETFRPQSIARNLVTRLRSNLARRTKGNSGCERRPVDQFITITTAAPETLPSSQYSDDTRGSRQLPKLIASTMSGYSRADNGAHHYRLVGLEISPAPALYVDNLVILGDGDETKLSDLPSDIELDRLYIHGSATKGSKRGVALNGISMVVKNCYISDIKSTHQDSQAIGGWNGPGRTRSSITTWKLQARTFSLEGPYRHQRSRAVRIFSSSGIILINNLPGSKGIAASAGTV